MLYTFAGQDDQVHNVTEEAADADEWQTVTVERVVDLLVQLPVAGEVDALVRRVVAQQPQIVVASHVRLKRGQNVVKHYQTWPNIANHYQTWSDIIKRDQTLLNSVKLGQTRSSIIKHDQTRSNMIKHGQTWSDIVRLGQT